MKSRFLDKLIERIGKVDPEEVQTYLLRLAREKGFLESIFNAIQEGVIVTDARGKILYLNQATCHLFGLDLDSSIGALLSTTVQGFDWEELLGTEKTVTRDMEVFYPQNRFLNFYVSPIGAAGAVNAVNPGYVIILRDITETRKTAEDTLESERLSALTMLAAGVAHEIGNPLNSLHIHLQLMERSVRKLPKAAREELRESIEVAKEEIDRLDNIVTQFLRAIRPSRLETQPEGINAIVRESAAFLDNEIKDRDILVEQELRSDLPIIEVDRNQIKQAFYNIIRNSFQAMRSGGILRIKTDMDSSHVLVSFSDTGGGISPENMGRLFQPYFTTKESGSGLGLLVVRRIVREHGGEMAIASDEGKGVTVTVRLPLRERRVQLLTDTPSTPLNSN